MDQFAQLPRSVASIISYQADLDACLIFGGHASLWDSLTDAYKDAPEEGGIYALGMMLGVKHDHADSRIVYIGSTVSLRKRLQTHRGPATHSYYLDELKRRYPGAISVAFIALPNLAEEWLRAIEGSG